jgi:L-asparaginase / beta-aspartyl-peptidase
MNYSIILHGGAGESLKNIIDDPDKLLELEQLYTAALKQILQYGIKLLKDGKTAIEVVEKCCIKLENNELFNAGVGATKNIENKIFHDAIIIDGKTKNWGAICNSNIVKNPIKLCKHIMNKSPTLIGDNENIKKYCKNYNLPTIHPRHFKSQLRDLIDDISLDYGTIGVVVKDIYGDMCAATSTGGKTNKIPGRIGDTPMNGISTICDNNIGGITVTGKGEEILKHHVASQVFYQMKYSKKTLKQSINNTLEEINPGVCGVIGIDRKGNIYHNKNTPRMYVAWNNSSNKDLHVELY